MRHDAQPAWRLFIVNIICIGLMALTLALGLSATGLSLEPESLLLPLVSAALIGAVAFFAARRASDRAQMVGFACGSAAQLILITALMTPLTYVAATSDLPLQDASLAALDRGLGLDWRAYLAFLNDWPGVSRFFGLGYAMIGWPLFAAPVLLACQRHFGRLQQFTLAFALALVATTVISTLVPALGAYQELGLKASDSTYLAPLGYLDQLRDFPQVRSGALHELDLIHLVGIITFPSFHAAAAVLYVWGFWAIWWMRPAAIIVEGTMLLATPAGGGHYFVDVFAGMGVAVLAIAAAGWIGARVTRPLVRVAEAGTAPAGIPEAGSLAPVSASS